MEVPKSTCVASGFQESNSGRFSSGVAERSKAPQRESLKKTLSIKVGHLWAMVLTE